MIYVISLLIDVCYRKNTVYLSVCNISPFISKLSRGYVMKKMQHVVTFTIAMFFLLCSSVFAYEAFKGPLGVLQKEKEVTDGYVLLTPYESKKTFLIDNDGNVIREWVSEHIGFYAELLPNGNMARHGRVDGVKPASFGGTCGVLEEFDWSGRKVWEYKMAIPEQEVSHHTFEVMPNGNYAILGWEYKSYAEAVAKGLDLNNKDRTLKAEGIVDRLKDTIHGIWPDFIREVDRKTGETVWEWHVWDHLGAGQYDKIDLNKHIPSVFNKVYAGPDWTHFNGLAYNPKTNEFTVTSRNLGEVYIINKETGKITYRWGNPANWGGGRAPAGYSDDADQELWGPHAPDWTPEGTITILDNGNNRPSGNMTRAIELDPKSSTIVWEWGAPSVAATRGNFYSAFQCGAQKLANGNWMITSTDDGHVVEVTKDKKIVWEFANPVRFDNVYAVSSGHGSGGDSMHKAMRYSKDDARFKGKDIMVQSQFPNWVEVLNKGPVAPMKPMPDAK